MSKGGPAKPRVPYRLTSTEIPGVFIGPRWPRNLNVPDEADDPTGTWRRLVLGTWWADDGSVARSSAGSRRRRSQRNDVSSASGGNSRIWAGVVLPAKGATSKGTFKGSAAPWSLVMGSWVVPSVDQPPNMNEPVVTLGEDPVHGKAASSCWVGLDGNSTNAQDDLLQGGTRQELADRDVFDAWAEWAIPDDGQPAPGFEYGQITLFNVSAGDPVISIARYIRGWQLWFPIWEGAPEGISPVGGGPDAVPGRTVSALWRPEGEHLDLFFTDASGTVWSTYWEPGGWNTPWFPIWEQNPAVSPGATVTALWRPNSLHLDLFVSAASGTVWSTNWEPGGWNTPWFPIWQQNPAMSPGATVTALWRPNSAHLDLFVSDASGTVWTTYWEAGGWNTPWLPVWAQTPAMFPGATVTALWQPVVPDYGLTTPHLDLFVTDKTGAVWSTFWEPGPGWGTDWFPIWFPNTPRANVPTLAGETVAAVWRPDSATLSLFITDANGAVWSTEWIPPLGGWYTPWFQIPSPENADYPGAAVPMQPAAPVTAVWRDPTHLDLFVTDTNGKVQSTWWEPGAPWTTQWFPIWSQLKTMQPGAPVTALWQPFYPHLDLFAVDRAGIVWSAWWIADAGAGAVHLFDEKTGQHQTLVLARPPNILANGYCAEWIVEDPDGGYNDVDNPLVLADFHSVTIAGATCLGQTPGVSGDPSAQGALTYNICTPAVTLTTVAVSKNEVVVEYADTPFP